jgi:hypothetical protein
MNATGATASADPPQNEDSAMTEAPIADHGLDLTRATSHLALVGSAITLDEASIG